MPRVGVANAAEPRDCWFPPRPVTGPRARLQTSCLVERVGCAPSLAAGTATPVASARAPVDLFSAVTATVLDSSLATLTSATVPLTLVVASGGVSAVVAAFATTPARIRRAVVSSAAVLDDLAAGRGRRGLRRPGVAHRITRKALIRPELGVV